MTMSTLSFQPEAERYYAEGYWRDGRPVERVRCARAAEHRTGRAGARRPARDVRELRRAAVALSAAPRRAAASGRATS